MLLRWRAAKGLVFGWHLANPLGTVGAGALSNIFNNFIYSSKAASHPQRYHMSV